MQRFRSISSCRGVIVALLFAAVSLAGACSGLSPHLDMAKIERGVAKAAKRQFQRAQVGVGACPKQSRAQKQSDVFECSVPVDGRTARYRVEQTDGHGGVTVSLSDAFILVRSLNDRVTDAGRRDRLTITETNCGKYVYIVSEATEITCDVTADDPKISTATVQVDARASVRNINFG